MCKHIVLTVLPGCPAPVLGAQDVAEALNRLPAEVVWARNARLKRAMDLSLKHEVLPKDLQEQQRPFDHYLLVCGWGEPGGGQGAPAWQLQAVVGWPRLAWSAGRAQALGEALGGPHSVHCPSACCPFAHMTVLTAWPSQLSLSFPGQRAPSAAQPLAPAYTWLASTYPVPGLRWGLLLRKLCCGQQGIRRERQGRDQPCAALRSKVRATSHWPCANLPCCIPWLGSLLALLATAHFE